MKIEHNKETNEIEVSFINEISFIDEIGKEIFEFFTNRKFKCINSQLWTVKYEKFLYLEVENFMNKYKDKTKVFDRYQEFWDRICKKYDRIENNNTIPEINRELRRKFKFLNNFNIKVKVAKGNGCIEIDIIESPYDYNDFEFKAIVDYLRVMAESYNYNKGDNYNQNYKFYTIVQPAYGYKKVEFEHIDKLNEAYKNKQNQLREINIKKYKIKEAQRNKESKEIQEYEDELKKIINEYVEVRNVKHYITNVKMSKECKANRLSMYQEAFYDELSTIKIEKEIVFKDIIAFEAFKNLLLTDFEFLGKGGHCYNDTSFTHIIDIQHMCEEEMKELRKNTIDIGTSIIYNNKLQFIVNCEGRGFITYVYFHTKESKLIDNIESIRVDNYYELEEKAFALKTHLLNKTEIPEELLNKRIIRLVNDNNKKSLYRYKVKLYELYKESREPERQIKRIKKNKEYTVIKLNPLGVSYSHFQCIEIKDDDISIKIGNKKGYLKLGKDILIYVGKFTLDDSVNYEIVNGSKRTKYGTYQKGFIKEALIYMKTKYNVKPLINTSQYDMEVL